VEWLALSVLLSQFWRISHLSPENWT
jgi:hypothetical protein